MRHFVRFLDRGKDRGAASLQTAISALLALLVFCSALAISAGVFARVAAISRLEAAVAGFDCTELADMGEAKAKEAIISQIAKEAPGIDEDRLEVEVIELSTEAVGPTVAARIDGAPENYVGEILQEGQRVHFKARLRYTPPRIAVALPREWSQVECEIERNAVSAWEVRYW